MKCPDFRIGDEINYPVLEIERMLTPDDEEIVLVKMVPDELSAFPMHPADAVFPVRR